MTCKDCIHYNVCNMYDGPYISAHLEHTCENFTDSSEWVHLPSDEYTFTIRGDIARDLLFQIVEQQKGVLKMTDKEITRREKTFSEELPYFKERIKEVFDNYNNPNGNEDPLYICVLRDSNRIVRKAEEEITFQQAEISRLRKEVNLVSIQFQDLQERTDKIKVEAYKEFAEKLKKKALPKCDWDDCVDVEDIDNLLKEMEGEEK